MPLRILYIPIPACSLANVLYIHVASQKKEKREKRKQGKKESYNLMT
jgi:hypothetical protein